MDSFPLRILSINSTDRRGGAAETAWDLFKGFENRGHDSWFTVGKKRTDDPKVLQIPLPPWAYFWRSIQSRLREKNLSKIARIPGAIAHLSNIRRFSSHLRGREYFDYPGTWEILNLPPASPDIVLCHNLHGEYFDLRFLPTLTHRIPVILNLHDMWLFTGHCAHAMQCERWQTGCGQCPDLRTYPPKRKDATSANLALKRKILSESIVFISAPSKWQIERYALAGMRMDGARVIPNGIDLAAFHPGDKLLARGELGLPKSERVVLIIAHNIYKDYATMIRALARLRGNDLLFICLGREGIGQDFGNGRLIFPGREADPRRMALYYQASDAYVHAAFAESFGKTITEAMACGTPVVATAIGGIPEQIQDGENGFLVKAEDAEAIASRLEELFKSNDMANSIAARAIQTASQFDINAQIDGFISFFQEVREKWAIAKGKAAVAHK